MGAFAISNCVIAGNNLTGNISGGVSNLSTAPVTLSANVGDGLNAVQTPTLTNGWVNNGGSTQAAGYWKDGSGAVHLQGIIKSGTVGAAAFTLPAGFVPAADQYFACVSNGVFGWAYVRADGQVIPQAGSNVYFSLSGMVFHAA